MRKYSIRQSLLAASAASVAMILAAGVPAQAGDTRTAAGQETEQAPGWTHMQERMEAMQAQMQQLRDTTDPAERRKLLAAHMQSMQEQMQAMRAMGGAMMMHGTSGPGGMGMDMDMGMGMGMGGGMGQRKASGDEAQPIRPGPRHQMMENRLDMMQMMMEQMMGQMDMQMRLESDGARD